MPQLPDLNPAWNCRVHVHRLRLHDDARWRWIIVMIYPTPEALRAAGVKFERGWAKREGRKWQVPVYDDTVGLFQPLPFRSKYDRSKRKWVDTTPSLAGVIRLSQGYLRTEVVAHESLHAAVHIARLAGWEGDGRPGEFSIGGYCDDNEEAFCHLAGDLTSEVTEIVEEACRRMGIPRV